MAWPPREPTTPFALTKLRVKRTSRVCPRDFDWDPRKAATNLAAHKTAFDAAVELFSDPDCVEIDVSRASDGERRSKAIGLIEGRLFVVVFTEGGGMTRVISARRANRQEERIYGYRPPHN